DKTRRYIGVSPIAIPKAFYRIDKHKCNYVISREARRGHERRRGNRGHPSGKCAFACSNEGYAREGLD
ncbi:MAG: hypothetical protein V3T59_08760, partial [Desulfobacterales bacterium]